MDKIKGNCWKLFKKMENELGAFMQDKKSLIQIFKNLRKNKSAYFFIFENLLKKGKQVQL